MVIHLMGIQTEWLDPLLIQVPNPSMMTGNSESPQSIYVNPIVSIKALRLPWQSPTKPGFPGLNPYKNI